MLFGRNFDFLGGYLMVNARYLVVTAGYCPLTGGYCSLQVITARYWWLLLVTARSHFLYQRGLIEHRAIK